MSKKSSSKRVSKKLSLVDFINLFESATTDTQERKIIDVASKQGIDLSDYLIENLYGDLDLALYAVKKYPQLALMADSNGDTFLHQAAYADEPKIIDALVATGANLNARNKRKETPLHLTLIPDNESFYAAATLLEHGANPRLRDKFGKSFMSIFQAHPTFTIHHLLQDNRHKSSTK